VTRTGGGYEISFTAPAGVPARADVFDVGGRRVAKLDGAGPAGRAGGASDASLRTIRWSGRGESGSPLARGVYFVRVETGGSVAGAKLVHLGE
jgi:hypothetical protein